MNPTFSYYDEAAEEWAVLDTTVTCPTGRHSEDE